jgi:uncharacterized protein (DUF1697 family)
MGRAPGTGAQDARYRFVALLRGVNVGGRSVPMGELRDLFAALGHTDIRTYIQTGNVLFGSTRGDTVALADEIRGAIEAEIGHRVSVVLRTPSELGRVLGANPYATRGDTAPLYVTFLDGMPDAAACARLDAAVGSPDEFTVRGREVYVWCPTGYGRTVLSNEFFERRLKLAATTRNWRTLTKLTELSGG